ncbi:MAG: T9SS type A sorting domain-containing protein [Bacteroidales bacterium]|nr:T9SS type A sorting domain-containing protein [Bacteroidales bacterium]
MKKLLLGSLMLLALGGYAQSTHTIDFETPGVGSSWNWVVVENADNPPLEFIANPDAGGINTSPTVAKFTARQTGQPWALCFTDDDGEFTFDASNCFVKIMVYKSVISNIAVKFEGFSPPVEIQFPNTLIDQWEEITYDFSASIGNTYSRIVIIPDFDFTPRPQDNIICFDNVQVPDGIPTGPLPEPVTVPPVPPHASADVISIYSDTYTNLPGTNFNPNWGQSTIVTVNYPAAGNNTLKYENLNYQGTQFTNQDVSGYEYLHIDFWTPNSSDLGIYLISPGPLETEYVFTILSEQWVSVDIPLTDFVPPVNLSDVFQFKVEGNGVVYFDNWYFWKNPSPPGTDATLSDLQVDGATIAGFSPVILSYNYDVPSGSPVPVVNASTTDPLASYVINAASSVTGTTEVVVTAQDGTTTLTYQVHFKLAPSTVPPVPPHDEFNVISIYTDTYNNVPGTNYNPWWGQQTIVTVDYVAAGNNTLKYANLNYQGTEYANQDVSGYEFLHVDFWTANSNDLSIYLISPGPLETGYVFTIIHEQWVSVDIPLSDFVPPVNLSDVFQFKVVGNGDVWFDNFYFWKSPPASTVWNGIVDNNWHDAGNWSNGVPGSVTDVTIPSGLINYPSIGAAASCHDIILVSDASGTATLVDDGYLVVNGSATVQRYYPTGMTTFDEWHLISAPVSDAQAGIYTGYYLQWYQENTNEWMDIIPSGDPLTALQGYAFYAPSDGMTFEYVGSLGDGTYMLPISASGPAPEHWNSFGNPFPSALDWDKAAPVNIANLQSGAVYYLDQASGAYLSYNSGMGSGSRFVPPGQGFFVSGAVDMAPFAVDNTMRTHTGGSSYYKAEFDNMLVISAEGNGYTDAAYIRFDEGATSGVDKQFDAFKIFTASNPQLPQLYTAVNNKFSINVLPHTEMLTAGFKAGVAGNYSIGISEVTGMANVILEDLATGVKTDLLNGDYTFYYNINDPEERFVIHFSPLTVSDNLSEQISIYPVENNVYVHLPENAQAQMAVYNTLGQEILTTGLNSSNNYIAMDKKGFYVVLVTVDGHTVSEKIFIN